MYKIICNQTKRIRTIVKTSLFFVVFLTISISSQARNDLITINEDQPTVSQVIKAIKSQTGLNFTYDCLLDLSRKVQLSKRELTLEETMNEMLKGSGRSYLINGNFVVIRLPLKELPSAESQSHYDVARLSMVTHRIEGAVLSAKLGLPIAKVQIHFQGKSNYLTETDSDGEFLIEAIPEGEYKLIVSHLDYETSYMTVEVEQSAVFLLSLQPKTISDPLLQKDYSLDVSENILSYDALLESPKHARRQTAPIVALKTNLLYDMTASFSFSAEVRVGKKLTLELPVTYNPWTYSNNKKSKIFMVQPELRLWGHEPFNRHFFGVNFLYAVYNFGGLSLPFGMWPSLKDNRYEGHLFGVGLTVGHHWILGKRWGLEGTLGVGYFYTDYTKYACQTCGERLKKDSFHYFGPTKLGLSLVYFIK